MDCWTESCKSKRIRGSAGELCCQNAGILLQGVVIDSLTAVFLLDGKSVSSVIGRALVSKFGKLFVSYDSASMSLGSAVQSLVPQLQAICKSSLSPANLKLVVQKVVELSLKPHAVSG